ncbi:MAG: hypothetical protein HOP12_07030 [Candidatus Eisenbacteria bacterium]|uniref:CARDB domain-containing protein n=1 Tax=Eiseniibacteriota bacterium TaxID=2212470 RepID=A0A849SM57_UNCEI|nr:hypothetical protein [Candidatus Eisenbacteria bacterium]
MNRQPSHSIAIGLGLLALLAMAPSPALAEPAPADSTPTKASSAVAAAGLLPVHGILVDLDALAAPGKSGARPSARSRDGAVEDLKKLWKDHLKVAGFNVVQFRIDVNDADARDAERLVELCAWAKVEGVRLAPCLVAGPIGSALTDDYSKRSAAFVAQVIEAARRAGDDGLASYAQIMLYALGRPLNHSASQGAVETATAVRVLKSAAEAIRTSEQQALAGTTLQPTPLSIDASFDYELIRHGAIVHTALTDDAYQQGYATLRDFLLAVVAQAPVEVVSVQWFPGSVSSEGVERLPDVVTRLQSDLPGKLLVIETGYSSAAGRDTAQARYYALAFQNLSDLRMTQGIDSPFAGIVWHSAFDRGDDNGKPEGANVNWSERAGELTRMWNDPRSDAKAARNWLDRVEGGLGVMSRASATSTKVAPKATLKLLASLDEAVGRSAEQSGANAAVRELTARGTGVGKQLKDRLQGAMLGLLDTWLAKTADDLFTTQPEQAAAPQTPGEMPDVQIVGIGETPTGLKLGGSASIPISLFNAGFAPASNVVVYLKDGDAVDLSRSNPTTLSPGGTTTIEVQWTPTRTGSFRAVMLDAYCDRDADPSTNRALLGDVQVDPIGGGGGTGGGPKGTHGGFNVDMSGVLATADFRSSAQSSSAPGFVAVEAFVTPMTFMTTTPSAPAGSSGGSTTAPRTATAGKTAAAGVASGATMTMSSGEGGSTMSARTVTGTPSTPAPAPSVSEPVAMTIVNPFPSAFTQATATLTVDDRVVATRSLGTILPKQRRTVSFAGWSPPAGGTYRVRVDVKGRSPLGKELNTWAADRIKIGSALPQPMMAAAAAPTITRLTTRSLTPVMRNPLSGGVRPMSARPATLGAPGFRSFARGGQPLGLGPNSIEIRPFPVTAQSPVQFSIRLMNSERESVRQARVRLFVDREDLGEVLVDVPAGGYALASGFRTWTASIGRHDVRAQVSAATLNGEATKPIMVLTGAGPTAAARLGGAPGVRSIGSRPTPTVRTLDPRTPVATMSSAFESPRSGLGAARPDLEITARDLHFMPAVPTANSPLVIPITVRNVGGAIARDARVLAVLQVDGHETARQQFTTTVAPGASTVLEWRLATPASGQLGVTATVTVLGDLRPDNNQARAMATVSSGMTPVKLLTPTRIRR